jgi:acetyl esterase/lipase
VVRTTLGAATVMLAMLAPAAAAAHAPNTGRAGSPCAAQRVAAKTPADPQLDTTSLGSSAPARYEIGAPTSSPESGQPVQRVMMFLHSGGWYMVGQGALDGVQPTADVWRAAGWETVNADYLSCGRSVASALKTYDLVREHVGPSVPICLSGDSAGGQLALLIASRRRDVSCVVADAAPTDPQRIAAQGAHAVAAGLAPALLRSGAATVAGIARAAFGRSRLATVSPFARAARIHTRVLLGIAADDPLIPAAQPAAMARALTRADPHAYVDTEVLPPGSIVFGHGTASPAAMASYYHHLDALVAPFGRAPGHDSPPTLIDSVAKLVSWLLPALGRS